MKVRIIRKPDFLRYGRTVYSVQKKYILWPFWWVEHGWYPELEIAKKFANELRNPLVEEIQ